MRMLVIGAPGCGKGTQGIRLAEAYAVQHIAAGDLLRSEISGKTELGLKVSDLVSRGELVPDELILNLVMPKVRAAVEVAVNIIVDGSHTPDKVTATILKSATDLTNTTAKQR